MLLILIPMLLISYTNAAEINDLEFKKKILNCEKHFINNRLDDYKSCSSTAIKEYREKFTDLSSCKVFIKRDSLLYSSCIKSSLKSSKIKHYCSRIDNKRFSNLFDLCIRSGKKKYGSKWEKYSHSFMSSEASKESNLFDIENLEPSEEISLIEENEAPKEEQREETINEETRGEEDEQAPSSSDATDESNPNNRVIYWKETGKNKWEAYYYEKDSPPPEKENAYKDSYVKNVLSAKSICVHSAVDYSNCVHYQLKAMGETKKIDGRFKRVLSPLELTVAARTECINENNDNSRACIDKTLGELDEEQKKTFTYVNPIKLDDNFFKKELLDKYPSSIPKSCLNAASTFTQNLEYEGSKRNIELMSPFLLENDRLIFASDSINNSSDINKISIFSIKLSNPHKVRKQTISDYDEDKNSKFEDSPNGSLYKDNNVRLTFPPNEDHSSPMRKYCITGKNGSGCGTKRKEDAGKIKEITQKPYSEKEEIPYRPKTGKKEEIIKMKYSSTAKESFEKGITSKCSKLNDKGSVEECISEVSKHNPKCSEESLCLQHLIWRTAASNKDNKITYCDKFEISEVKDACKVSFETRTHKHKMQISEVNKWPIQAEPIFVHSFLKGLVDSAREFKMKTNESLEIPGVELMKCAKGLYKHEVYKQHVNAMLLSFGKKPFDEDISIEEESETISQ